ncbi:predicted protein [Histoplasma mississippiense (nom. inval.)]|uniref:predicted protein n=1 Tax=Ajellomyces capsulatus (strain NAm1 / WU24) TaxID=2059318 RepID=UPI000157CDA7|nr:predicted protein [Histoplasma mississippiense (nom. inval.)]EDN10639.1 predicted protein [Histoplasma mississippiense (nom. inval.)]
MVAHGGLEDGGVTFLDRTVCKVELSSITAIPSSGDQVEKKRIAPKDRMFKRKTGSAKPIKRCFGVCWLGANNDKDSAESSGHALLVFRTKESVCNCKSIFSQFFLESQSLVLDHCQRHT